MATSTLVSVDEYLRRNDRPASEFRDGIVTLKPMPNVLHGVLTYYLQFLLRRQGWVASSEVRLPLSSTKFLVPDVIAGRRLQRPYPSEPVPLCIEILSVGDRIVPTLAKCEEYHAWGVPCCWVIDPVQEAGWEFRAGMDPVRVERSGVLRAAEGVSVALDELFALAEAEA